MRRAACCACVLVLSALAAGCQQPFTKASMEEAASAQSPFVGQPAPDFILLDQDSQPLALSAQKGHWVVLYFYPKDDTPGCTCQATEFTKLLTKFRDMDAEVYGISEDSPASHRVFIKAYGLGLRLLSDPDHRAMTQYGAWVTARAGEKTYGRVIRTTVILDPKGIVAWHWPEVIPEGHADRVRKKLAELQAAASG